MAYRSAADGITKQGKTKGKEITMKKGGKVKKMRHGGKVKK